MKTEDLENIEKAMDEIISQAEAYRKGDVKVPHMVIKLTGDKEQSDMTNHITSVLYEHKLRRFGGLDLSLEYRLDGSLKNIRRVFENITDNAVYTNEFEGVVAIDVSALSEHVNESQVDIFMDQLTLTVKNATVIIYYDRTCGKRMEVIKDRICKVLGNYREIHFPSVFMNE